MLLGDGSPTRHLQLLTNQETKIKLISMQIDPLSTQEGPTELNQLNGPLIRRQVWIKSNNKNLAWAESCLLYTSPSPRDSLSSRMPSSA